MPKFLVTSGSYFEPMTYDEIVKPLAQMAEVQNATQDVYDTLGMETAALEAYLSENEDDQRARALYNDYRQKLENLQNNLWGNGFTPQTRRDLYLAKTAYASNINPIKDAVERRQALSSAYWDARHKNPDLIAGRDPGTYGLDNYLDNKDFGNDWYSYSGKDFMNQVGFDARARANEMLYDPEYMNNPELAGYITRITRDGFTNVEVENASALARRIIETGNTSALENASLPETILASVLLSNLESTGARGKVSNAELNRLLDYGKAGLSQAIGKTDVNELKDNNWELAAQKSLIRYRKSLENAGTNNNITSNRTSTQPTRALPYTLNDIASYMEADNAKRINDTLGGKFVEPFKKPIIVNNPDGSTDVISSPFDAEKILNSFGREKIYNEYGINPDSPEGIYKLSDGQGGEVEVRIRGHVAGSTGSNYNGIPLKDNPYLYETKDADGKWKVDEHVTKAFNEDIVAYRNQIKEFKKGNKDVNLQKLAISDKRREKIYNEYDIPEDVPFEDVPFILQVKSGQEYVTPATIAGSTIDMDSTRKNYTRQIITSFSREAGSEGKVAKGSPYAFYPADKQNISDKGIRDIKEVLGDSKGNITDDAITEIVVYPEDLNKNKVRFTANGKQYAVDSSMLGNDVNRQIQMMKQPVNYMMLPILDPVEAMRMDAQENTQWVYQVATMLGDYFNPAVTDVNGNIVSWITPRDIVKSQYLQTELRTAVTRFMNNVIAESRDNMMQNNYRVRGNTNDKATGYNDYIE